MKFLKQANMKRFIVISVVFLVAAELKKALPARSMGTS